MNRKIPSIVGIIIVALFAVIVIFVWRTKFSEKAVESGQTGVQVKPLGGEQAGPAETKEISPAIEGQKPSSKMGAGTPPEMPTMLPGKKPPAGGTTPPGPPVPTKPPG